MLDRTETGLPVLLFGSVANLIDGVVLTVLGRRIGSGGDGVEEVEILSDAATFHPWPDVDLRVHLTPSCKEEEAVVVAVRTLADYTGVRVEDLQLWTLPPWQMLNAAMDCAP